MREKERKYYEAAYTMAGLNHTECVGEENLGWTKGVLSDGVPFEAELWLMDEELTLCVMLPDIFKTDNDETSQEAGECKRGKRQERQESCVLKIGTFDRGYAQDFHTIIKYVEYLEESQLVEFCGERRNGAVHLFRDKEGNDIAGIIITLNEAGDIFAETPLVFKSFQTGNQRIFMYKKMHI